MNRSTVQFTAQGRRPEGRTPDPRLSPALQALRERLRSLQPPVPESDLLYDLMGFGRFTEMALTRDGLLIARPRRSVGFSAFLGRPRYRALERVERSWRELGPEERRLVLDRLRELGIEPHRVGIPAEAKARVRGM